MNQKQYHSLEELPLMMNMTDVAAALGISRAGAYKLAHIFVPHTADPANRGISRVKRQSVCRFEMPESLRCARVCKLRLWKYQGRRQRLSCSSSGAILPASDTVSGSFGFLSPIQGIKIRF